MLRIQIIGVGHLLPFEEISTVGTLGAMMKSLIHGHFWPERFWFSHHSVGIEQDFLCNVTPNGTETSINI